MQKKILRSFDLPDFKQAQFSGTLFRAMTVIEYGGDIVKQSALTYADELIGLYVQTPSVRSDRTPRRLDGQPDGRYTPITSFKSGAEPLDLFLNILRKVVQHGNLLEKKIPSSSTSIAGFFHRGGGVEPSVSLICLPFAPIYYRDNFQNVSDAIEILERLAANLE